MQDTATPKTNQADEEYMRLLTEVLNKGKRKKNRTGVDAFGCFGAQARFDLAQGFPLLTTKKVFFKGVVHELLWFLSGSTNIKYLVDNDVHIWDEWAYKKYQDTVGNNSHYNDYSHISGSAMRFGMQQFIEQIKIGDERFYKKWGELGYGTYGSVWTGFEVPVEVETKTFPKEPSYNYRILNKVEIFGEDELIGKKIETKASGILTIVGRVKNDKAGRPKYQIQFDLTGYLVEVRKDALLDGHVADPYYPSVAGVGFTSNYVPETEKELCIYRAWAHMLDRCYNPNCREYPYYGGKGVFVANRWLSFKNFTEDAERLDGWEDKKDNLAQYHLDKDYYKSNCYCPEACIWLAAQENRKLQKTKKDEKRVVRPINQIQKVVDKLKTNPDNRRLIVSAWHPYWVDHCALPPCHCLFQFHTEELTLGERRGMLFGSDSIWDFHHTKMDDITSEDMDSCGVPKRRLNCQLYQRSCDLGLGVCYNWASYALLTMMMAQVTNMVAGDFIWSAGDLHIYENHIDALKLQLTRIPYKSPSLILDKSMTNLFDFRYEHITLKDYVSHPAIKMDVAV